MDQQDTSTEHGSGIPGRNEGLDSDRKDATRTAVHTNNQKTLGANPQNVFDEDSMQDTTDLQSKKRARSSSEGSKEENDMVLFKKALVSETPEPKTNQSVDSKGSPDSVDKARDPRIPPPSNEFTSTSEKPRPEDESLSSRSSMPSDQQDSTELGSGIPGQNGGLDFDRKDVTRTAVYTNNQKTLGANPQNVFDEDSMQDTTDLQSKKRARSSSEGSKEENDMVLFKKALVSETPEPKANQFADSKCSPDSVDKDRDPRIPPSSNEFTGISEKPRPEDESLSSRGSTPSEESSSPGGIFDDADEDDTFDLSAYKQPDPPPRPPLIRPDLVAAILGTPPKTKVQQPIILKQSPAQKADEEKLARKKKHTKPAKKLFITKKEQEGAEALVSGKVDLLKILPEKDCHFLGNELWIFTLQQLASILGVQMETSDTSPGDSTTSNMCTPEDSLKRLRAKLIKSSLLRTNRTKTDGNEFEREEQTKQKTSIQTPPVEASNSNDLHSNDAGSDMKQDPVLSSLDTQILGSDAVAFDSSNRFSPQPQDRDMQSRDSGKVRPAVDAVETKDQIPKETTQTGNPLRDDTSCSQDVEAKIDFWKKSIRKWQDENKLADDNMADKTHFPLDGPLSCLLPACTLRFLQSVKIKNAYDFMCLKRTETGVIVDMYRLWRSKCNLSDINALSLAKNLIAVGSRIEVALGSMPHADIDTIQWMSGPMIVLTGAAKDFVITDEKIYDANDFVGRRTKDMSNSLIKWRKSKGLPLLKGTGNVAMISQWKYLIKEEMNVMSEEGKIITEVDFAKEVKSASSLEPEKKKQKSDVSRETKIKSNKKRPPKVEAALHSETFLSTLFAEDKVQAMASVGVTTAQGFLDADKRPDSPLIRAVIKMRSNSASGRSLQPSSCVRLMYEWCQRVKQRLDDIEKGKDFEKKPVKRSKTDGKPAKKPKSSSTASIAQKQSSNDPFDSLSSSTKVFLASMEIDTAESFLSARTTDIANAFIKWREERNLPVLKGLGAVASVSGWKALVRKAAKHVGKEDIAALNPGSGSTGATETKSPVKIKKPPPVTLLGKPVIMHAIDRGVLFGLPRKRFSVANSDQLYQFELTVRKSTMQPSKSSLYLKYLGNHWLKGGQTKDEQSRCFNLKQDLELLHLPILTDHDGGALDDSTGLIDPFCSLWPQCGVVELSKYGVQPLPRQGTSLWFCHVFQNIR